MGSFGEGLLGGLGGLLSTGSPLGIGAGFLSGIFGGDTQQVNNYTYTSLSPEQQNMTTLANNQLAGLMRGLSPDAQNSLIAQLQGQFSSVLNKQTNDAFNLQSSRARANMARTGGGPSSVMNSQLGQLAAERSKALNASEMQSTLMANQIGGQRFGQSLAATQGLGGLINQAQSTRRVASTSANVPGSNMGALLGGIGVGLTDPNSQFSQNNTGLGWFGAPLYGQPAVPKDTGTVST